MSLKWSAAALMASGGGPPSLLTNLVSYWKLDESSGTLADSVGGNTGTASGTGTPVLYSQTGIVNTSVRIQNNLGNETRIDMGDPASLRLTSTGSISCWANVEAGSSASPGFVSKVNFATARNGYGLFAVSAHPYFVLTDASGFNELSLADTTMANGTWYHIVITWDSSIIKGYVNGIIDSHTTVQTRNATSTGINFTLGRGFNGTDFLNFGLAGKMDEVGVWSRAITRGEAQTLYNSGNGKAYPF